MKHLVRTVLAGLALSGTLSAVAAPTVERYTILANGESIGQLVATSERANVSIDYQVSNNGRGPKVTEQIVLGAAGVPVSWTVEGTSLMGGAVQERMAFKAGTTTWTSQADAGSVAGNGLYIGNDASPWALGQYARILMKKAGGKMAVLPAGEVSLQKLRAVSVQSGGKTVALDAYVLNGINLTPDLLLMDRRQRLFAKLSGSIMVRAGHEGSFKQLQALAESLTVERLQSLQQSLAHKYEEPVRIRNVRIFDPLTKSTGALSSVVVYRGRIATIEAEVPGAPAPAGQVAIDGQGGTLVAGLHDMHAHNSLWSGLFYLAAGVTTTRDMGNDNAELLSMTKQIDAGTLPGPHIIRSGFLEGRSAQSARHGFVIDTLQQGLDGVRWYADRGYTQIKIYNSMNPAFVKPLVAEAKRLGLRAVGHVPAFSSPDRVLAEGFSEITHINQMMLGWLLEPGADTRTPLRLTAMAGAAEFDLASPKVAATLALMKANGAALDTTASIVEQLMLSRAGTTLEGGAAYLGHLPIGYQRYRKRTYVPLKDGAEDARYVKAFDQVIATMALLHKEGIRLLPGTDDATGFSVHRELELYVKAGLTPAEALRAGTYDCDQHLGREQEYGSIERGKRADLFLVPGDPAADINALRTISMVMKDGVIYYPSEIYESIGVTPFVPAPPVTLL